MARETKTSADTKKSRSGAQQIESDVSGDTNISDDTNVSGDIDVSGDTKAFLKYEANKKNMVVAYLLLIFLGYFGIHRFYAGAKTSGIVMLVLFAVSWILTFLVIGFVGFAVLGIWWFIDLFLLHGLIVRHNDNLASELSG